MTKICFKLVPSNKVHATMSNFMASLTGQQGKVDALGNLDVSDQTLVTETTVDGGSVAASKSSASMAKKVVGKQTPKLTGIPFRQPILHQLDANNFIKQGPKCISTNPTAQSLHPAGSGI